MATNRGTFDGDIQEIGFVKAFNKDNVFEGVCDLAKSARRLEELIKEA